MKGRTDPHDTSTCNRGADAAVLKDRGYRHFIALAVLVFIAANLACWICPLLVLLLFKWMIPIPPVVQFLNRMMVVVYQGAVTCHSMVLFRLLGIRLKVDGIPNRFPGRFYLVTANHQSWSDIFILQHIFNRKAPILKFLVKRELVYMPLVGLICWAYDFPFLRRRSLKKPGRTPEKEDTDAASLGASLSRFVHSSATVMNFAEGTRYAAEKARQQESPHRNLLRPRAGGLSRTLAILGDRLDAVVDVTLVYDHPAPTFWRFIGGGIRRVRVRTETIPAKRLSILKEGTIGGSDDRAAIRWINARWTEKDREIDRIRRCWEKERQGVLPNHLE
jgi:1-acyl-sn-glycerol-3-phosphate acyltransferase